MLACLQNGVDALYLVAYHRLSHAKDPKGFLTFYRAAQLAEPKRPPTWPPIQNAHLKNMLSAELKFYEGTGAGNQSTGGTADAGKNTSKEPLLPQSLRNVAWPVVEFSLLDAGVRA